MGADWNHPVLGDSYSSVLTTYLNGRDLDSLTMCNNSGDPSNIPTGAKKYDETNNKLQRWSGSAWVDLLLDVTGGGTGSATASGARTNLGLGTMATQNSNTVAITGGSISGVTMDASVLTTGTVALARGGTGASLTIGASGSILQSNGSAVVFGTDGSQLTSLNASNLASGTVPLARLPAGVGGLVQTVSASSASVTNLSSSSYVDVTGATVTITPKSSSNKVKISFCFNISVTGTTAIVGLKILRNGSTIKVMDRALTGLNASQPLVDVTIFFMDSPATTSAVVYKLQAAALSSAGAINTNGGIGDTIETLAEEISV